MKEWLWRPLLAAVLCLGVGESYRRTVPLETPIPAAPPAEAPFSDVSFGQRWYDGAQYGYRRGVIRGMTETEFGGELTATRAMAATMVWRMAGEPEVLGRSGFRDVEPGKYYTPAVVWGETQNLWEGFGDGTFRPDDAVTRGQLELVLGRYLGERAPAEAASYSHPSGMGLGKTIHQGRPLHSQMEEDSREMSRGELAEALMELCERRQ